MPTSAAASWADENQTLPLAMYAEQEEEEEEEEKESQQVYRIFGAI